METKRPVVKAMEEVLDQRLHVLDDGFVRVVDYMGGDDAIVQAARVSFGAGTKRRREDRALIRYLMRNRHTTPFEMCELKLHVRVPMDTWRQWIRHRTASVNEYSTRYSVAIDSALTTRAGAWRTQSGENRQGSAGTVSADVGARLTERERQLHTLAREVYEERLAAGVAREQARKDLPLSTYTEAYWKIDLHNLLNFLALRMDAHAQAEIRAYADVIGTEIVARWCPAAWEAFTEYRRTAITFGESEAAVVALLLDGRLEQARDRAVAADLARLHDENVELTREGQDLDAKLSRLGVRLRFS